MTIQLKMKVLLMILVKLC